MSIWPFQKIKYMYSWLFTTLHILRGIKQHEYQNARRSVFLMSCFPNHLILGLEQYLFAQQTFSYFFFYLFSLKLNDR